jgi:hypothetical protein
MSAISAYKKHCLTEKKQCFTNKWWAVTVLTGAAVCSIPLAALLTNDGLWLSSLVLQSAASLWQHYWQRLQQAPEPADVINCMNIISGNGIKNKSRKTEISCTLSLYKFSLLSGDSILCLWRNKWDKSFMFYKLKKIKFINYIIVYQDLECRWMFFHCEQC